MPISFPRALIFDWDNTLVDSWPAIMEAINITRKQFGQPTWNLEEIKANCTRAARDSFPEWFGEEWEIAYAHYYGAFDKIRKSRGVITLNGAETLIRWLKEKEIPTYIVSNKRGDYLRYEIGKLGWDDLFTGVAGAHDAPKDKPAREHIDHAIGETGVTVDASVWFVGDSETDVLCARNAGCTPVLIGTAEDAKRHAVEMVFQDCQALQTLLNSMQQKQ